MFERRIKSLLLTLAGFTLLLLLRAGWLQVVQGADYERRATETGRRSSYLETLRGNIVDFKGRIVAEDVACIDAAVDYRAINLDDKESQEWLRKQAIARVSARGALKGNKDQRTKLVDQEVEQIKQDLAVMWGTLAKVSGKTPEEIEAIKQSIKDRVTMRQRYVFYKRFEEAKAKRENQHHEPAPAWYRWLVDDSEPAAPKAEDFKLSVVVAEQTETHPILHAIDNEAYIALDKLRERCPGLELKKGIRRNYPFADVGCHVIGHMAPVTKEEIKKDTNLDEGKKYFSNDYIGRGGLEGLAEKILRGSRGRIVKVAGRDTVLETVDPKRGEDVQITLDMDLQMRIQEAFLRYEETDDKNNPGHDLRVQQMKFHEMHGAAIVIDVPTGQVRALVSYPTYDLNQFDLKYSELVKDQINQPLLNRATQAALEPGSTVKPLVGLSAITAGLARPDETVECTGYLVIDGRTRKEGRCWVASKFGHILTSVAHHPIPSKAPHPTGFLTFADALERSCNVFFETMADRLKMEGLNHWMSEFGLGRLTEIGIAEAAGRIPGQRTVPNWRSATWFSGIGQAEVNATPIQMANVAATIARRGIWIRPHLLVSESAEVEHRDLHLNPQAIEMAHQGMINVVNSLGGTGTILHRDDILIAGKTGTAQAAKFNILKTDDHGKPLRDENNHIIREYFDPSTPDAPNRKMPWYRGAGNSGSELGHAWFIGFAPARDPKIAFAVLVEYGGSGGKDAGPVAQAILEACIEHGYLSTSAKPHPTDAGE